MSLPADNNAGDYPRRLISTLLQGVVRLVVEIVTFPYHRFFAFNTLKPIKQIEKQTLQREKLSVILASLARWRALKTRELEFISIACVTLTAVITASFSWSIVTDAHWTALGLWYASLTFSICGVLLSAQQVTVLSVLGALPERADEAAVAYRAILRYLPQMLLRLQSQARDNEASSSNEYDLGAWTIRWKMVFTWQVPMMFTGYSFLCYIIGLTVLVCSPLIQGQPWGPNSNVAIAYLAVFALGWSIFVYCSLMGYEPIDLEVESDTEESNVTVSEVHIVSSKGEASSV